MKLMVIGKGDERVVSRVDPYGVYDKKTKANSVLCSKWVHNRCSDRVKGSLKKVSVVCTGIDDAESSVFE